MEYAVTTIGPVSKAYLTELIMAHMNYVHFRPMLNLGALPTGRTGLPPSPFPSVGSRASQFPGSRFGGPE